MTSSDSAFHNWDDRINEGWLERYVLGDLDSEERRQLEDHLTESEEARDRLREIEPMDEFMTQALAPFAVKNLEDRVIHAVKTRGRRRAPRARRFAVAASTLLALFSVGHVMSDGAYENSTVAGYVDVVPQNPFAFFSTTAERLQGDARSLSVDAMAPTTGMNYGRPVESESEMPADGYYSKVDKRALNGAVFKNPSAPGRAMLQAQAEVMEKSVFSSEEMALEPEMDALMDDSAALRKVLSSPEVRHRISKSRFADMETRDAEVFNESAGRGESNEMLEFTSAREKVSARPGFTGPDISLAGGGGGISIEEAQAPPPPSNRPKPMKEVDAIDRLNMIGKRPEMKSRAQDFTKKNQKGYYYRGDTFTLKNRHGKDLQDRKKALEEAETSFSRDADEVDEAGESTRDPRQDDVGNKLIRTGYLTFEVEGYNSTVNRLVKIARENEGYLASEQSNRGANGKMQGVLVFRIRADHFGNFMANIRGIGDMQKQDIRVQDVSKAYFDVESRIQSLEVRRKGLLKALEDRKGDLEAYVKFEEKLAAVISELEKLKGELRYMANQVAFSTLRITLVETGIGNAAAVVVNEKGDMQTAVPDVESALDEARRRAKELGAEIIATRVNRGRGERDMSGHLGLEIKVGKFDQLVKALGELGKVSRLTRSSDDEVKGGKGRQTGKREEGVGELTVTFYHLPSFTVEDNRMSIDVASAPVAYDEIRRIADNPAVKILTKNIDSMTDKAKTARFDLEIRAADYSDLRARIRSLGRVAVETGSHIEAVTPEGDPIPSFQEQVVRLNLTFNKLPPLTTETLKQDLHAESVKDALRRLKDEARTRGFKLLDQQGDNESWGRLEFDLPESAFEGFRSWIDSDKNADKVGHVDDARHTSLRENPERMKEVPDFQEKRARVTLNVKRLTPLVAERQELGVKVEDVAEMYLNIRGLVRDVKDYRILDSNLDYEGRRAHLVCHVPVEAYGELVRKINELGEGNKVIHKRAWSHEENPNDPIPGWKPRVGRVELVLDKMLPTRVRTSELTLYSDNPEELLSKISSAAAGQGEVLDSNVKVQEDGVRTGNIVLQVPLDSYEGLMDKVKDLVGGEDDILTNTGSMGNLADPKLKDEKLVAHVTLKTTNSREGSVAHGGASAYFGRTFSMMGNFFLLAFNKVLVGMAFIGPFALAIWILVRMLRRKRA